MKTGYMVKMGYRLLQDRNQNDFDGLTWSGLYKNEEVCDITDQLWERDEAASGIITKIFEEEVDNEMREMIMAFFTGSEERRDELLRNRIKAEVLWNNEDIPPQPHYIEDLEMCSPKQLLRSYIRTIGGS
jgi:hypothetical protein